jgi:hypothetical protein
VVSRWLAHDDVRIVAVGRSPQLDYTFTHSVTWAGGSVPAPIPTAARVADTNRYTYVSLDLSDDAGLASRWRIDVLPSRFADEANTSHELSPGSRPFAVGPTRHWIFRYRAWPHSQRFAGACTFHAYDPTSLLSTVKIVMPRHSVPYEQLLF